MSSVNVRFVIHAVAIAVACAGGAATGLERPPNIAKGVRYKCVVPPNYWGWKGPRHGDRGQLTDGKTVDSWMHQGKPIYALSSSAGWSGLSPVIVLDLGKSRIIGGIGLHSVLSPWGPWWPSRVTIMVSEDNRNFTMATRQTEVRLEHLEPRPSRQEVQAAIDRVMAKKGLRPTTRWYRSPKFVAKGRYVALLMDAAPATGTIVIDDVEVYSSTNKLPPRKTKQVFSEGAGGWKSYRLFRAIKARISRDLRTMRRLVADSSLAAAEQRALTRQFAKIAQRLEQMPVPLSDKFAATLPINAVHAELFAVQAALWRAQGIEPLRVWTQHRFDPLSPFAAPGKQVRRLETKLAGNAVRGLVVNLSNPTAKSIDVIVRIRDPLGKHIRLFKVPFNDTFANQVVCSALIPLRQQRGEHRLTIAAGMHQQIYLQVHSKDLASGKYTGAIDIREDSAREGQRVPLVVTVSSVTMPGRFSLHLGGWDYPVAGSYQVTNENVAAYVKTLRAYGINTTWCRDVLPLGGYDKAGNLTSPPSRRRLHKWLKQFPDARLYCTVLGFSFPNDPHAEKKTTEWARDWSRYLQSKGYSPGKFAILIRDEPTTLSELQRILKFARAIRRGESRFKIWNDIHWKDPEKAPPQLDQVMKEACDIQCSNVMHLLREKRSYVRWTAQQRRPGLSWWVYTGGANDRLTDPYVAFQLRSWFCFERDFTGAHWWAFGDGHGGYSWNEYLNSGVTRSPLYLRKRGVFASKSMEAMREGAQDYELLSMLRAGTKRKGTGKTDSPRQMTRTARQILQQDVRRVLASHSVRDWQWKVRKDRTVADQVRLKLLRVLEALMP